MDLRKFIEGALGVSFRSTFATPGMLTFTGGWQRRNRLETDEEIKANQAGQLKICWGALDGPDQECHPVVRVGPCWDEGWN